MAASSTRSTSRRRPSSSTAARCRAGSSRSSAPRSPPREAASPRRSAERRCPREPVSVSVVSGGSRRHRSATDVPQPGEAQAFPRPVRWQPPSRECDAVSVRIGAPLLPTYARFPVTFVAGEGSWLVDEDGKRYLDLVAGIAVVSLGHRHPAPLEAAQEQLERLWHVSNLYSTLPMEELATKLSDRFGGAHAFFCNSGTEAVEAAIKWARKVTGRRELVALEGSFHGRMLGALSVTREAVEYQALSLRIINDRFERLTHRLNPESHAAALRGIAGRALFKHAINFAHNIRATLRN